MKRALFYFYSTNQIIPALAATEYLKQTNPAYYNYNVVPFVYYPGASLKESTHIAKVIDDFAQPFGWHKALFLDEEGMRNVAPNQEDLHNESQLAALRNIIGSEAFDEVFFSHAITGNGAALCMLAYPSARYCMCGDGFGYSFEKDFTLATIRNEPWNPEKLLASLASTEPRAQAMYAIIPADQSGFGLYGTELVTIPKSIALDVITTLWTNAPELQSYCAELIESLPAPRFVFVMSYLTDCGASSIENELSLCEELVHRHVPRGGSVVIKPHPNARLPVSEHLAERLKSRYTTVIISPQFGRYPLEIWRNLVLNSEIISWSYVSISLLYLYGKKVITGIDAGLLNRYITPSYQGFLREAEVVLAGQRQILEHWDGTGVAWRNNNPFGTQQQRIGKEDPFPEDLQTSFDRGAKLLEAGEVSVALQLFLSLLDRGPAVATLWLAIGICYWSLNDGSKALDALERAAALEPENAQIRATLANARSGAKP